MGFQLGSLFSQQTPFGPVFCQFTHRHRHTQTHMHTHVREGARGRRSLPPMCSSLFSICNTHDFLTDVDDEWMCFCPCCGSVSCLGWTNPPISPKPRRPKTQQRTQFWEMKTELPKTRLWNMFPFLDLFIYFLFSCVIFPSVTEGQRHLCPNHLLCRQVTWFLLAAAARQCQKTKKKKKTKNSSPAGWGGVKPRPVPTLLHCFYKNTVNLFWRFGSNMNACRRLLTTFAGNEKFFEADLEF